MTLKKTMAAVIAAGALVATSAFANQTYKVTTDTNYTNNTAMTQQPTKFFASVGLGFSLSSLAESMAHAIINNNAKMHYTYQTYVGYKYNRYLALVGGVSYTPSYDQYVGSLLKSRINARFTLPVGPYFDMYAKLGGGYSRTNGSVGKSYVTAITGAGFDIYMTKHIGLNLDSTIYLSRSKELYCDFGTFAGLVARF